MSKTIRRQKFTRDHEDPRQGKSVKKKMLQQIAANEETDSVQYIESKFERLPTCTPARISSSAYLRGEGCYSSYVSEIRGVRN